MKLLARDIVLFVWDSDDSTYKALAAATSCSLDLTRDLKEISGIGLGTDRAYVSHTKGWTMSGSQFVGDRQLLDIYLSSDDAIQVVFAGVNDRDLAVASDTRGVLFSYCGEAFISSLQIVGEGAKGLARYNVTLTGSGALTAGIPGIQFQEHTGLDETTSDDEALFVRNIIL